MKQEFKLMTYTKNSPQQYKLCPCMPGNELRNTQIQVCDKLNGKDRVSKKMTRKDAMHREAVTNHRLRLAMRFVGQLQVPVRI